MTLLVGWWLKARCVVDGDWVGGQEYLQWCYTDILPLYAGRGLAAGGIPYLDNALEYPVLTGLQMWLAAGYARGGGGGAVAFFHVTAMLGALACLGVLLVLIVQGLGWQRLVWWAGAPTLAAYAFMNWDPVPVLLLSLAIAAHRAGRDRTAGVLVGLGTAAKLFPGLLVPLVVLARLHEKNRRAALEHAVAAVTAWAVVNVPVFMVAPNNWLVFYRFNRAREADAESLWFLAEQLRGNAFDLTALNLASTLVFLAGATVIVFVGTGNRPGSRWWELLLPVLAWFLLTNKVYSPQFSLWLLPLMAMALPSASAFAAFVVADLAVFLVTFPYVGGVFGLDPAPGYPVLAAVIIVRWVVLMWVIVAATVGPRNHPDLPLRPFPSGTAVSGWAPRVDRRNQGSRRARAGPKSSRTRRIQAK